MVATSNRPPKDLYKNGLNRELFLPFIDVLYHEAEVLELEGDASSIKSHHKGSGHHHTNHQPHGKGGHVQHQAEASSASTNQQQPHAPSSDDTEQRGKSGPLDYRKLGDAQGVPIPGVFNYPISAASTHACDKMFAHCSGVHYDDERVQPTDITIAMHGRKIHVPAAYDGVCRWNFLQLCGKALGAADYIALAEKYHTIVGSIPPLL